MRTPAAKSPATKPTGRPTGPPGPAGPGPKRGRNVGTGVVRSLVRGVAIKGPAGGLTPSRLVERLREGLPGEELEDLRDALEVSMERLGHLLGISKATLHRRLAGGRLGSAESDRVVRFARLMGRAVEVMEAEEPARRWLASPQFGLGGAVPLEYAGTEVGAREVEDLLGRIEFGVYS